jgi:hypothetical protein
MHSLLIPLMTEAVRASETLVNVYQSTWHYNLEDSFILTAVRTSSLLTYVKTAVFWVVMPCGLAEVYLPEPNATTT